MSDSEYEELRRRRQQILDGGGKERVAKHHAQGKMTARERIETLLDPDSFLELEPYTLSRFDTKNKYYGDGVMALFTGAPDDAVNAAIMMQAAVNSYNREREEEGFEAIEIGIGLHCDDLMLGIIGSEDRMQGAVVADAVNLAARIEGLNRMYGSYIALSEETLSGMEEPDRYRYRFMDKVLVKGKECPVTVYEIFEDRKSVV